MAAHSEVFVVMPKAKRTAGTPAAAKRQPMLYLASHGLQTPISAIRWGCGRLKRMAAGLPPEQRQIVEDVQEQAKLLSRMFEALLLLAKVEDGTHISALQDIYLHDFLQTVVAASALPQDVSWKLSCPDDLRLRTDRALLTALTEALLLVVAYGARGQRTVHVTIARHGTPQECIVTIHAPLQLALVEDAAIARQEDGQRIVGGVPGVMLSVAAALASALGGSLQVHDECKIVLKLPSPPSVSVLPEA